MIKNNIVVGSSQYGYVFGNNQVHFPYSIASLVSYAKQNSEIENNFQFEKIFLYRNEIEKDIKKAFDLDILLCSCYCWNWEITTYLAKEVKKNNPNCLIIFGGPEVPEQHENFFLDNPFVDIIVHGEGEVVLQNVLLTYLKKGSFKEVLGIETKDFKNPSEKRIEDLDIIPSPYSSGLIWELIERKPNISYTASWETDRGCPFQCTFCDWGSATKTKIRTFSEEKLYKEIEWFGENEIVYVDVCDGNFGIFPERGDCLVNKLVEVKTKTNYPEKLGLTWVKASSEKILPLAKKLKEVDLLRAVSLSVQSLDDNTLKIIKRKNIKFDKFEDLTKLFDSEGIQTYTELIMGLPGETIETYKNNWEILAAIYPAPSILTWNCSVFNNAPMNDKLYKKMYGIEVFDSPIFLAHSLPDKEGINEYERMVRKCASLPNDDIIEVYTYNWMMLVFHAFGILEFIARFYVRYRFGTYTDFYNLLENYCKTTDGLFAQEYKRAVSHCRKGYNGEGWGHFDSNLGEIAWSLEEASWLRLTRNKEILRKEIINFTKLPDTIVDFQLFLLNFFEDESETIQSFDHDWVDFFQTSKKDPVHKNIKYTKKASVLDKDVIQWGYATIWFGRRGQKYKTSLKEILINENISNRS